MRTLDRLVALSLGPVLLATAACTDPAAPARDAPRPTGAVRSVAPARTAVTTERAVNAATLAFPHAASGENRHLVVLVHHAGPTARTLTSVTYAGAALSRIAAVTNGVRVTEMWHVVAPALGTNTVAVAFSGTPVNLTVTAISRAGVDQAFPVGVPATAANTGGAPAVAVAATAGNVVQDALTWAKQLGTNALATVGAGQAELTNTGGTFELGAAASEAPGAPTVTTRWTLTASRPWGMIGVEIRAAPAPADVTPPTFLSITESSVSPNTATIAWTTDEPTDARVEYGPDTTYGSTTALDPALATSHVVSLGGLSAGTTYHYRVVSRDAAGNAATSGDRTFNTPPRTPLPAPARPNILLIVSDNQNERSVGEAMTHVQSLLAAQGVTFTNAHVPYPLCCPERATFLTGQYPHNHGVMDNSPPAGGYTKLDHARTLPVWLSQAGYHTVHIGKYLNGYGVHDANPTDGVPACQEVPPGWSEWYGNIDSDFHPNDFVLNENGAVVRYGAPKLVLPSGCAYAASATGFQTDVYSAKAVDVITRRAAAADGKPFFLTVAYGAPAGNTMAAPRHAGAFAGFALPKPPSFNESDVSDKPLKIRNKPVLGTSEIDALAATYRRHLSTLLAIDEGVRDMVNALAAAGQLSRTVIIYLSDQGALFGEHRATGVAWAYEESVQVPFFVRGPGFPAGQSVDHLVSGVDLAPTIVDLAGAAATRAMDGRSLLPLVRDPSAPWRAYSLMEVNTREATGHHFNAVRDARYVYIEHGATGAETELYDLQLDPFQLRSRHADPAYAAVRLTLKAELGALKACAGAACWR